MKTIGWYETVCERLSEQEFGRQFSHAFLLQHWAREPLRPVPDTAGGTVNPLLSMDRLHSDGPTSSSQPEHAYVVFEARPRDPTASRTSIGFAKVCDVQINDESLSAIHAFLEKKEDGSYELFDADSATGTQLNGKEVTSDSSFMLKSGDSILLGYVALIYLTPEAFRQFARRFLNLT